MKSNFSTDSLYGQRFQLKKRAINGILRDTDIGSTSYLPYVNSVLRACCVTTLLLTLE